jgi:hypothetical protein
MKYEIRADVRTRRIGAASTSDFRPRNSQALELGTYLIWKIYSAGVIVLISLGNKSIMPNICVDEALQLQLRYE